MKKLSFVVTVFALSFWVMSFPAFACGDNCDDGWIGGKNDLDQWQDWDSGGLENGGFLNTSGGQNLDMWGKVHVPNGKGEYESLATHVEGVELTFDIPGGEIFADHLAMQKGEIDITGGHAYANLWGENEFSQKTSAGAEDWSKDGEQGRLMWSDNNQALGMNGKVCLAGHGEASYLAEVLQQTGHEQKFDFADGKAFTRSLSQQRGFMDISKKN